MSMHKNLGSLPLLVLMLVSIGEAHAFEIASRAISSGMVYGSMLMFVGCTVYSLSKQGFLKQTTLRANYARGLYAIIILWSVNLAYMSYMHGRPLISSDKTFRRLQDKFWYSSKSRMQALSDLHFNISGPQNASALRFAVKSMYNRTLAERFIEVMSKMDVTINTQREIDEIYNNAMKGIVVDIKQQSADATSSVLTMQNNQSIVKPESNKSVKKNTLPKDEVTIYNAIIDRTGYVRVTNKLTSEEARAGSTDFVLFSTLRNNLTKDATTHPTIAAPTNWSSNTHAEQEHENERNAVYYTFDNNLAIWRPEYLEKCTSNGMTIKRDHDIPKHDMGHLHVKLESCVNECWFNEQCQGFSYDFDGGTCWLKDGPLTFDSYLPKIKITSGFVDQSKRKKFLQRSLESWATLKCPPVTSPPHSTSFLGLETLEKLGDLSRTNSSTNQTGDNEVRRVVFQVSGNEGSVPGPQKILRKALKYDRQLPTGFGDRMSVYLTVSAAAATVGADVHVYWHDNPGALHGLAFESIRPFVRWPDNMHVLREVDFEGQTRHMDTIEYDKAGLLQSHRAFDAPYTTAWRTLGLPRTLPQLSRDAFELSYRKVGRELRIECPSREWEPVSMSKFVVLHFRGDDKMEPLSEFNTMEVLRRIPGHVPVVVVTDDDNRLNEMLSVAAPFAANITRLRPIPDKSVKMMRDFAVLLNATGIIQHSTTGWSSYSSVPAMIRGIPLLSTWLGRSDEAAIITSIQESRRSVRNVQQSLTDAEEHHDNGERATLEQKLSKEEDNLRSLEEKLLLLQNASRVGQLHLFVENGGCPVELRSSKKNEEISVFLNTVTLQMQ